MNQAADSDRGEKTADNIRYGQNISESGQGGMTEGMGGDAMDGEFLCFLCVGRGRDGGYVSVRSEAANVVLLEATKGEERCDHE